MERPVYGQQPIILLHARRKGTVLRHRGVEISLRTRDDHRARQIVLRRQRFAAIHVRSGPCCRAPWCLPAALPARSCGWHSRLALLLQTTARASVAKLASATTARDPSHSSRHGKIIRQHAKVQRHHPNPDRERKWHARGAECTTCGVPTGSLYIARLLPAILAGTGAN